MPPGRPRASFFVMPQPEASMSIHDSGCGRRGVSHIVGTIPRRADARVGSGGGSGALLDLGEDHCLDELVLASTDEIAGLAGRRRSFDLLRGGEPVRCRSLVHAGLDEAGTMLQYDVQAVLDWSRDRSEPRCHVMQADLIDDGKGAHCGALSEPGPDVRHEWVGLGFRHA